MPILILLTIIGLAIAVAILYPQLRLVAGLVVAIFLGLIGIYFVTGDSAVTNQRDLDVELVILEDIALAEERGYARLSGRVTNGSETSHLRSFKIDLKLFDCPDEEVATETCAVIAEDDGIARVDVPAGQTRQFESVHRFSDTPPLKGVLRWDIEVLSADASR